MGAVFAVFQFNEIIARKSLHSSEILITFLTMSWPVTAVTSLWWARLIEKKDQRKLLLIVGSFGCLVMATGAFLFTIWHLIILSSVFFFIFALFGPAENRILQQNVASKKTGKTFGFAFSLRMGIAALVSAGAGIWLDRVSGGFRNLYPTVAFVCFFSIILLSSIRTNGESAVSIKRINWDFFVSPLRDVVKLLKRRPDYLRFEIAFMLYGIAFMMTLPVVPLYLVDDLELKYSIMGLAKGAVTQITMIISIQFFGNYFDKSTPHKLGAIVFASLSLYPLLLLSASLFEGSLKTIMVYITFGYFGLIMSGTMVLWQLSSIRFSGKEDAGVYHSVHVAATGLRGMIAPLMGYFVMMAMGKTFVLLTCSFFFLVGSAAMILARKIDNKRNENISLRAG